MRSGCADAARGAELSYQRHHAASAFHRSARPRQTGRGSRQTRLFGLVPSDLARAIDVAAAEVAASQHDAQFPIDVFQTGSGTSTNMNANEVIAHLASRHLGRAVHANDEINMSRAATTSFHDYPRERALAVERTLLPALEHACACCRAKEREVGAIVKTGRTHLMDAMPWTLGQSCRGWRAIAQWTRTLQSTMRACSPLRRAARRSARHQCTR